MISKHQGKASSDIAVGGITLPELRTSMLDIVRLIQKGSIRACDVGRLKPVKRDGLLLQGGRVQTRSIPILPSKGRVTEPIIQLYHQLEGHSGPYHVLAAVRREFWVIKGMTTVKRAISKCLTCRIQSA